jgi:hypothetical protein
MKPTITKKSLQNLDQMEKVKVYFLIAIKKEKIVIEEQKTNQS